MTPRPPRVARALLAGALDPEDRPFVLGDLEEEFEALHAEAGARAARRWYRRQVLSSLVPVLRHRARLRSGRRGARRLEGSGGGMTMGMDGVVRDLLIAGRTLARAPLTVLVTVVSLGLGIGAVTTVFTAAEALLWPDAVGLRQPERLVTIYTSEGDGEPWGASSWADFVDVAELDALADAAVATVQLRSLAVGADVERVIAEVVSPNYFTVTGIPPAVGRMLLPADGEEGNPVVVLGHRLWMARFGGESEVVGRTVRIDGAPVTVVGVAPEGLGSRRLPLVQPDLWLPVDGDGGSTVSAGDRADREFVILGRYAEGVGRPQLQAQLDGLAESLAGEVPEVWTDESGQPRHLSAVPERESRVAPGARMILGGMAAFFFGVTFLVLAVAAANVTSLFLVRALARAPEIALRRALGAGRGRIVRLLATEGLLLGAVAGVVGILVARGLSAGLGRLSPPVDIPLRLAVEPGARASIVAMALALGASLVFSLLPALRASRPDLVSGIKGGNGVGGGSAGRRVGPGSVLVAFQFASAFVLVAGAGLFLRSLQSGTTMDLGLDPTGVAVTTRTAPGDVDAGGLETWYGDLLARARSAPGVERAALSRSLEMTLLQVGAGVNVRTGGPDEPPAGVRVPRNSVTPGYLEMLDVPLLQGRPILESDVAGTERVAVVNRTFQERFWPGSEALGRTFVMDLPGGPGSDPSTVELRVVGVAENGTYMDLGDPPMPYVWTSLYQEPARTVVVALEGADAAALAGGFRTLLPPAPGELPLVPPTTYESQLSIQVLHLRVLARVLAWGGGIGLFLAVIGVYGVVSFTVARRTREWAIRRAVGAEDGRVTRSVLRHGLGLAGVGLLAGGAVLLLVGPLLRGVLLEVAPLDPVSLGGAAVLLLAVAGMASWMPARRAVRVDPMRLLGRE